MTAFVPWQQVRRCYGEPILKKDNVGYEKAGNVMIGRVGNSQHRRIAIQAAGTECSGHDARQTRRVVPGCTWRELQMQLAAGCPSATTHGALGYTSPSLNGQASDFLERGDCGRLRRPTRLAHPVEACAKSWPTIPEVAQERWTRMVASNGIR